MGSPYPSQAASGYNASPPADDGSVSAANKITWAKIKTQLGDAVKGLADAINTALRTALNVTPTTQSSAYTTTAADHLRPIEVTGTTTISLGDAATMVAQSMGYQVPIVNSGTATVTVGVVTATDKISGRTNGSVTLAPGQAMRFAVNSTNNGYDIISAIGFSPVVLTGVAGTNTVTANAPASLTALYAGLIVVWTPAITNTGATTINITPSGGAALGAINVFNGGAACVGQECKATVPQMLEYDGTQFNILGAAVATGTWTPSVGGTATYTVQNGRYAKIGNMVAITMDLQINAIGSGSGVAISGLPFTAVMNSGLAVVDFSSAATSITALMARIQGSGTTIDLRSTTAAQATAGTSNILGNGSRVMLSGTYLT